jgi:hypothetical protein
LGFFENAERHPENIKSDHKKKSIPFRVSDGILGIGNKIGCKPQESGNQGQNK